jgi:mono/diheme cytochrome c family protein
VVTKVLKAAVPVAEILGIAAAIVFVVLLVAKGTSSAGTSSGTPPAGGAAVALDGAALYRASCASCHGSDGGGRLGPQLADRVAERFPNAADEALIVTVGRGGMPSFGDRLTPEEIAAIVDYTRSGLG